MKFLNKFVVVVVAGEMDDDAHIHSSYVAAGEQDTTWTVYLERIFDDCRLENQIRRIQSFMLNNVDDWSRRVEKKMNRMRKGGKRGRERV